ncbi:MAG: hypothetical protein N2316_12360 [Spirochaetes bacterium]|nr:hypothetical protein [Spirochaetota bacterium]
MKIRPEKNSFIEMFQTHYDEVQLVAKGNLFKLVENLITINDDELVEVFSNDLGNTWMLYSNKLKGKSIKVAAICLTWNGYVDPGNIPTLVFSDAYESYSIESLSDKSHVEGIFDSKEKIFASVKFGNKLFDELGGFDIDFVTNYLIDADDDVFDAPAFEQIKMLYIVKLLDLTYRAVKMNVASEQFRKLPKHNPFAFFAFPKREQKPVLICEVEMSSTIH